MEYNYGYGHEMIEDNTFDTEELDNEYDLEEIVYELEDGNQVDEAQLEWAVEQGIDSLSAAKRALEEMRKYQDPIISVPEEFVSGLRAVGEMAAHETWDNERAIRGRIGKAYEGHEDGQRALFKIMPHVKLNPRFTSNEANSASKYYGVFEVDKNYLPLVIGRDIVEIEPKITPESLN